MVTVAVAAVVGKPWTTRPECPVSGAVDDGETRGMGDGAASKSASAWPRRSSKPVSFCARDAAIDRRVDCVPALLLCE